LTQEKSLCYRGSGVSPHTAPFLVPALAFVLLLMPSPGCGGQQVDDLSAADCEQIRAPVVDKASLTGAQRKLSSDLLLSSRAERCRALGHAVPATRSPIRIDEDGLTLVDLKTKVTEDLLTRIRDLEGIVVNSFPQHDTMRARLPMARLEALAESPDVKSIRAADEYQLH